MHSKLRCNFLPSVHSSLGSPAATEVFTSECSETQKPILPHYWRIFLHKSSIYLRHIKTMETGIDNLPTLNGTEPSEYVGEKKENVFQLFKEEDMLALEGGQKQTE